MEPNDMEPISDDSIFQINEELFWLDRLPKMSARELFDRIHNLFPDHCESVLMLRRLIGEAYRRLNEADALRKENEKLRNDKERIDFLDDGNYGIDPRNIPGVMINGRRFHCLAGRGDWNSLRDAIDAARLVKESDASHDR